MGNRARVADLGVTSPYAVERPAVKKPPRPDPNPAEADAAPIEPIERSAPPEPLIPGASKVSSAIARAVLRGGNYPWLKIAGARVREKSRRRGGRRFVVRRPDGVTLDAWLSPRDAGTGLDGGTRSRIPVVICHGIFEFKERHFDRAAWLNERGHDVILFDHRTHGRSTGKRLTFGVHEREDVRAVIDLAVTRGMVPPGSGHNDLPQVVTLGFSLGGGTVLQHAATDERVAGVIALAPFCDFRTAVNTFRLCFTPWMDEAWLQRGFDTAAAEAGFEMEQASALDAIEHIDAPILLAEGGKDPFLPPGIHSEQLKRRRGDNRLTVIRVDDAHHVSLVRRRWPQLDDAIAVFLDQLETTDGHG